MRADRDAAVHVNPLSPCFRAFGPPYLMSDTTEHGRGIGSIIAAPVPAALAVQGGLAMATATGAPVGPNSARRYVRSVPPRTGGLQPSPTGDPAPHPGAQGQTRGRNRLDISYEGSVPVSTWMT